VRDKVKESELWSEAFIMVKIGMFLPEERMVEPARKIIEENHLDVVYLEAVHTVDAVNKARIAVEAGAHILVARGYQAKLIKEYTNIPVVEIRFHAQDWSAHSESKDDS
jgi:hypothetical protein